MLTAWPGKLATRTSEHKLHAHPQSRSLDWRLRREAGGRAVDPDLAQLPCAVRHNEQHDSLLPRPRVHCMSSFLSTTSLSLSFSLFLSLCLSQRGTARQHGLTERIYTTVCRGQARSLTHRQQSGLLSSLIRCCLCCVKQIPRMLRSTGCCQLWSCEPANIQKILRHEKNSIYFTAEARLAIWTCWATASACVTVSSATPSVAYRVLTSPCLHFLLPCAMPAAAEVRRPPISSGLGLNMGPGIGAFGGSRPRCTLPTTC